MLENTSYTTVRPFPRRQDVRVRNDRLAERARAHKFYPDTRLPLICECDSDACSEFVRINLHELEDARRRGCFIIASGHRLDEPGLAVAPL